jgi:hypothetical protein
MYWSMKLRAILQAIRLTALIVMMSLPFASPSFANSPIARDFGNHSPRFFDLSYRPVLGDFDGDRRIDEAQQHSFGAHICIRVRFGDWRESHLDFGTLPRYSGTLLAMDVNHDDKPDLIWLSQGPSESAVVWPNEGRGHFGKATGLKLDDELRGLLFNKSDRTSVVGVPDYQRFGLTPCPVRSDAVGTNPFDYRILSHINPANDSRRYLDLCRSVLRERGPPQKASAV